MTKLLIEESVVRQCLEALETNVPHYLKDRGYEPITALRAAIEQQEKVEHIERMRFGPNELTFRDSEEKVREPIKYNLTHTEAEAVKFRLTEAEAVKQQENVEPVEVSERPFAYYKRLAAEYEKGLSICEADYRQLANWQGKVRDYLECMCGDRCNAEYNPCEARELLNLLDHPAPAIPEGWQPIETAPKDGKRFLAVDKDSAMGVVWWNQKEQMLEDLQCLIENDGMITNWMPLPAAPEPKL